MPEYERSNSFYTGILDFELKEPGTVVTSGLKAIAPYVIYGLST